MTDVARLYMFEVKPEDQSEQLKIRAKEQGHNKFIGIVQYSIENKSWYLTTDGMTYTPTEKAQNVNPILK